MLAIAPRDGCGNVSRRGGLCRSLVIVLVVIRAMTQFVDAAAKVVARRSCGKTRGTLYTASTHLKLDDSKYWR